MYTVLEDEVFLAPESIISGVLAADLATTDDAFEVFTDADYTLDATDLDAAEA